MRRRQPPSSRPSKRAKPTSSSSANRTATAHAPRKNTPKRATKGNLLQRLVSKLFASRPNTKQPQRPPSKKRPATKRATPPKKIVAPKQQRVSPPKTTVKEPKPQTLLQQTNQRITGLIVLLLVAVLGIIGRLVYLQLIQGPELATKAQQSRNHSVALFHRGNVVDRRGLVLAQDQVVFDAFAHPRYFGDLSPTTMSSAMAPVLNIPEKRLVELLSRPYSTIRLASNITHETVNQLRHLRVTQESGKKVPIGGLDFPKKLLRRYPQDTLAAHVLGYVNDDAGVSSGIEWSQRATLKHLATDDNTPANNARTLLDGRGRLMSVEELHPPDVIDVSRSDDVVLTLDARLQFIAEEALKKGLARAKAERGSVIMLQPHTGDVLAFAVAPTYAPERYFREDYANLKNWALSDVYPPGSTMKILTVANGLETGAISPTSRLLDTGRMMVGGWSIQNYDYYRHPNPGMIDLVYLFQHSSNIASAKVSMMTPRKQQYELLSQFGLGQPTGIELPGESAGILPPYTEWDKSGHASLGYGYGLAATPLQMAAAVAAIANDGVWVQPHLIKQPLEKLTRRRVLKRETARTVKTLLEKSIAKPTRSTVRVKGIRVAGKTGTSRKPNDNGKGYSKDIFTSFVGFYPADHPSVLVFVVVDSPKMAQSWGSTVAGPIFKEIAENSLEHLGLRPLSTKVQ